MSESELSPNHARVAAAHKAASAGWTIGEFAESINVSPQAAGMWLRRYAPEAHAVMKQAQVSEGALKVARTVNRRMTNLAKGKTVTEVAADEGVTVSAMSHWVRRNGGQAEIERRREALAKRDD
jgi:transposase